jgi:pimeloyl-ACP methyl ester carboxylesterase
VVFVHGCCLTSKTWETTPDGRMGWYEYFTRKGHATYLADQVGRGRSALDASIFNEVREGVTPAADLAPVFVATREMMWNVFRLGPKVGEAWPDQKFPMSHVEELQKQLVPDFISFFDRDWIGNFNNGAAANMTVQRLASLAVSLDGAVLVGHSQSSPYPTQAALLERGGVKGIVGIETGCFSALTPAQIRVLTKVPILIIVGDHLGERIGQQGPCDIESKAINDEGGDFTYVALPDLGIHGNSHMLMQDTNNLQIADIVLAWIRDHVEAKRPPTRHAPARRYDSPVHLSAEQE